MHMVPGVINVADQGILALGMLVKDLHRIAAHDGKVAQIRGQMRHAVQRFRERRLFHMRGVIPLLGRTTQLAAHA